MQMKNIRIAFAFLTSFPLPPFKENVPFDFGKAAGWFPLVGCVIGGLLAFLGWACGLIFSLWVTGILITTAWVLITGGLHLDGVADCCDGMLSAVDRERRLEIMKDPRLGTFGGAGLILVILLKSALAADLASRGVWLAFPLAASLGRWVILLAARQPAARQDGLGKMFAQGITKKQILFSALIPVVLVVFGGISAWVGMVVSGAAGILIVGMARRRLGGISGDVLGCLIEVTEVMVLLGMSMRLFV